MSPEEPEPPGGGASRASGGLRACEHTHAHMRARLPTSLPTRPRACIRVRRSPSPEPCRNQHAPFCRKGHHLSGTGAFISGDLQHPFAAQRVGPFARHTEGLSDSKRNKQPSGVQYTRP